MLFGSIWAWTEKLANQCDSCPPQKGQIQGAQGKDKFDILVFLTNTTLISMIIVHCKLYQKVQND